MTTNTNLLNTNEAAQYLGLQPSTLRNARSLGKLAGTSAPPYKKLGAIVRYEKSALDEWLDQFKNQTSSNPQRG